MTPCKPFLPCFHIHRLLLQLRRSLVQYGAQVHSLSRDRRWQVSRARFGYLVEQPREPLLLGQTRSIWTSVRPLSLHLLRLESCGLDHVQFVRAHQPDVQPTTAINCWIAAILLFDFERLAVNAQKFPGSRLRGEATLMTRKLL